MDRYPHRGIERRLNHAVTGEIGIHFIQNIVESVGGADGVVDQDCGMTEPAHQFETGRKDHRRLILWIARPRSNNLDALGLLFDRIVKVGRSEPQALEPGGVLVVAVERRPGQKVEILFRFSTVIAEIALDFPDANPALFLAGRGGQQGGGQNQGQGNDRDSAFRFRYLHEHPHQGWDQFKSKESRKPKFQPRGLRNEKVEGSGLSM